MIKRALGPAPVHYAVCSPSSFQKCHEQPRSTNKSKHIGQGRHVSYRNLQKARHMQQRRAFSNNRTVTERPRGLAPSRVVGKFSERHSYCSASGYLLREVRAKGRPGKPSLAPSICVTLASCRTKSTAAFPHIAGGGSARRHCPASSDEILPQSLSPTHETWKG